MYNKKYLRTLKNKIKIDLFLFASIIVISIIFSIIIPLIVSLNENSIDFNFGLAKVFQWIFFILLLLTIIFYLFFLTEILILTFNMDGKIRNANKFIEIKTIKNISYIQLVLFFIPFGIIIIYSLADSILDKNETT